MSKITCEDCYEAEAQITYLIGNTDWASCFECLKHAITDKDSIRLMAQAVPESED
jgi:hypothetical protein